MSDSLPHRIRKPVDQHAGPTNINPTGLIHVAPRSARNRTWSLAPLPLYPPLHNQMTKISCNRKYVCSPFSLFYSMRTKKMRHRLVINVLSALKSVLKFVLDTCCVCGLTCLMSSPPDNVSANYQCHKKGYNDITPDIFIKTVVSR